MVCDECSKCWFNYIEECEGQHKFKEDKCRKLKIQKEGIVEADDDDDDDDDADADADKRVVVKD